MRRDFDDPQHVAWRDAIFKRDGYRCQACGKRVKYPNAHHLNGYNWFPSGRYEIRNGVTLCSGTYGCHKRFHDEYGRGNNTEGQFDEFLRMNFQKTLRDLRL